MIDLTQSRRPGFVMMLVLILMIFFAAIAQRFSKQLLLTSSLSNVYSDHEQARLLAFSGLSIVLTDLFCSEMLLKEKDERSDKKRESSSGSLNENEQLQSLYRTLLKNLNLWQEFEFSTQLDGARGKVKVCVMCEDGKLNINNIIDAPNKRLKNEYLGILEAVEIKQKDVEPKKLTVVLQDFFAKRQWRPVEDPTELDFGVWFKRFYVPPKHPKVDAVGGVDKTRELQNIQNNLNEKIALTDVFTTMSAKNGLNPLLLSNGLCKLLGYGPTKYLSTESKDAALEKLRPLINFDLAKQWTANFGAIQQWLQQTNPLPDKSTSQSKEAGNRLDKIQNLLFNEIEPKFLSVLCCGEFKKNKQTVLFIVERQSLKNRANLTWSRRQNMLVPPGYNIVRLYFGIDEF